MGNAEIKRLVAGLEDFRTRSECMRELTAAGKDAVGPLTESISKPATEGAKWAMIKCLGSIGDPGAIAALAPLLKEKNMAEPAREALAVITGQDLGPSPEAWLKRAEPTSKNGKSETAPEMRKIGLDEERLIELIFEDTEDSCKKAGQHRYSAEITVEKELQQAVRIDFSEKDHEGEPIVIVYSRCGKAREQHYDYALRRNLKMPYGALAVADTGGGPQFVMFNTLLRQDMSAAELKKSILTVAQRAAQVGKELKEKNDETA